MDNEIQRFLPDFSILNLSQLNDNNKIFYIFDETTKRSYRVTIGQLKRLILSLIDDRISKINDSQTNVIYTDGLTITGDGTENNPLSSVIEDTTSFISKPGYVTWTGDGLSFEDTPATYYINGNRYDSPAQSLTLEAADSELARYDSLILNTDLLFTYIKGEPSENPVIPQIDPDSQILLTNILINAGATEPANVSLEIIYDENSEGYFGISNGVPINLDNTSVVYHGLKSLDVGAWTVNKNITFTKNSGVFDVSNSIMLKVLIYLKSAFTNSVIGIQFLNGNVAVSKKINFSAAYGFDKTLINSFQNISIPISVFNFTTFDFNKVRISLTGNNPDGFYLDYFQLQAGVNNPVNNYFLIE